MYLGELGEEALTQEYLLVWQRHEALVTLWHQLIEEQWHDNSWVEDNGLQMAVEGECSRLLIRFYRIGDALDIPNHF